MTTEETYCTCIEDDDGNTVEMCELCNESIMNQDKLKRAWELTQDLTKTPF